MTHMTDEIKDKHSTLKKMEMSKKAKWQIWMYCSLVCRQSLCGTSCLQTTWTQTLWSAVEWGWRTFCYVWLLIQYSPMTGSSTTSSLRYAVQLRVNPAVHLFSSLCLISPYPLLCVWQEHGWKEAVCETGFQAKVTAICRHCISLFQQAETNAFTKLDHLLLLLLQADSRLRALSATFRVRNPDK